MGSEEYEPDARAWADMVLKNLSSPTNWEQIAEDFSLYFNVEEPTNEKMAKVFYPYQYGYPWEVRFGCCRFSAHLWTQLVAWVM